MRMLDNVIEYNYYSVSTARDSNMRHRPVGMGIMGFNDALYKLRLPYETDAAIQFADYSMEADQLLRDQGQLGACARARRLQHLQGLAVEPGHPADGLHQHPGQGTRPVPQAGQQAVRRACSVMIPATTRASTQAQPTVAAAITAPHTTDVPR